MPRPGRPAQGRHQGRPAGHGEVAVPPKVSGDARRRWRRSAQATEQRRRPARRTPADGRGGSEVTMDPFDATTTPVYVISSPPSCPGCTRRRCAPVRPARACVARAFGRPRPPLLAAGHRRAARDPAALPGRGHQPRRYQAHPRAAARGEHAAGDELLALRSLIEDLTNALESHPRRRRRGSPSSATAPAAPREAPTWCRSARPTSCSGAHIMTEKRGMTWTTN